MQILAKLPHAEQADISLVKRKYVSVPQDYIDLVSQATDLEIETDSGKYIRIWGPRGSLEMDEGYEISNIIPSAFPIGDDGGGRVLFYATGPHGFGLYLVGFGNLDIDDAIWVAPTLEALLCNSDGVGAFN